MKTTLKMRLDKIRSSHSYRLEKTKLEFIQAIWRMMERKGVTNAELSRRLDTSSSYVTKVMRGDTNFTLDSLVKISHALGCNIHIHVADCNANVRWMEAYDCSQLARAESQNKMKDVETTRWEKIIRHGIECSKEERSEACRVYA